MHRALPALLALVALPAGASLAGPSDATTSQTSCLGNVDAALCVTATIVLDVACRASADGAHALCDAPYTWSTEGHSALLLPGQAVHAASANLEWCRPGSGCQGYGIAALIEGCSFGATAPSCAWTYGGNLFPGPIPLSPGDCMPVTLTGFTRADGYLVSPGLSFGHPAATAQVTGSAATTFCL